MLVKADGQLGDRQGVVVQTTVGRRQFESTFGIQDFDLNWIMKFYFDSSIIIIRLYIVLFKLHF